MKICDLHHRFIDQTLNAMIKENPLFAKMKKRYFYPFLTVLTTVF